MLSLKLFNSVLATPYGATESVDKRALRMGLLIQPKAMHLADEIVDYYTRQQLSGVQLNSTFHKSWNKVLNSSREELFIHQILHYMTTYGFESMGVYRDDTIYIPNEKLEIPFVEEPVSFKVIKALTREELIDKCLDLFKAGIALKQDTINDVLALLNELNYSFTAKDLALIKNKEAKLVMIDRLGIMPTDGTEFVRFLVWKATGSSLLIKDRTTIQAIKSSNLNINKYVSMMGEINVAKTFNRFKPLFLAFKHYSVNRSVVNRLSKLSKKYHEPMRTDVLSKITSGSFSTARVTKALSKTTNFRRISILYALHNRMQGSDSIMYRIRNGSSYVKETKDYDVRMLKDAFDITYRSLLDNLDLKGKVVKLTEGVNYALPTSEKKFVGNLPEGTSVNLDSDLIAGIHWNNSGGARDLDLSTIALDKVGWNSCYKNTSRTAVYSGDITSAPSGATEAFMIKSGLSQPTLLVNNIFSGTVGCKFKIFVAHEKMVGNIQRDYTVDPNKVLFQVDTEMGARQAIVGMFVPQPDGSTSFVLMNTGFGSVPVSSRSVNTDRAREFLFKTMVNPLSFEKLLEDAGATIVKQNDDAYEVDVDLTVDNLERDSIINLLK